MSEGDLEGDAAPGGGVLGDVDRAHAAAGQEALDAVLAREQLPLGEERILGSHDGGTAPWRQAMGRPGELRVEGA